VPSSPDPPTTTELFAIVGDETIELDVSKTQLVSPVVISMACNSPSILPIKAVSPSMVGDEAVVVGGASDFPTVEVGNIEVPPRAVAIVSSFRRESLSVGSSDTFEVISACMNYQIKAYLFVC
jgi:hypothetical protein